MRPTQSTRCSILVFGCPDMAEGTKSEGARYVFKIERPLSPNLTMAGVGSSDLTLRAPDEPASIA